MSTKQPDGGSAFPTTVPMMDQGMSLRDYFAAKAMQAYISDNSIIDWDDPELLEDHAADFYNMADAMIKVKGQNET